MNLMPQARCRRCGATFSGLRSRCPNCGTRVVSQSSRVPGTTPGTVRGTAANVRAESNARWQLAFGLILVVAVMLAVIVMVTSSLTASDAGVYRATPTPMLIENNMPQVEAAPTPEPTPEPTVESIKILYMNTKDLTPESAWPTMHVGEAPLSLNATVYPLDIVNPKIEWDCSDKDGTAIIMTVNDDDTIKVECVGPVSGGVTITASCFGKSQSIKIYCRE